MSGKQTDLASNSLLKPHERGNEIREVPILFSVAMVRAVLEGRKTMTRRVVKPQPMWVDGKNDLHYDNASSFTAHSPVLISEDGDVDFYGETIVCPYGKPGDRLSVREPVWRREAFHANYLMDYRYCATEPTPVGSIDPNDYYTLAGYYHRITLEVTGVRVERLLEISEQDARLEGIDLGGFRSLTEGIAGCEHRIKFRELWESFNGPGSWDANPWVWVIEFRRFEK